ncbi:hypothetical protein [Pseudomonas sp. UBA2684]|uniref:hypothetical protein n=1 Tax=Pseudomonas sp. UBA2684 TaxID=1947311 RepID=UPI0025FBAD18|nr:hypothetical protein [Pseudomonas sp. UBA2684]|tara:strand:- start:474 stop:761 length:288 start_codon:yes stop_codon:yes gene_type:complete
MYGNHTLTPPSKEIPLMPLDLLQAEQLAFLKKVSSDSPGQIDGPDGIQSRALESLYKQRLITGVDGSEGSEFSVLEPALTQAGYNYMEVLEQRSA